MLGGQADSGGGTLNAGGQRDLARPDSPAATGTPNGTVPETSAPSTAWRLRAAVASLAIPPLLELVSFSTVERLLRSSTPRRAFVPLDAFVAARWVDGFLAHLRGPWRSTCLRRSAILYYLLRSEGRPVELCIGVRREADGSLHAHAWLLLSDRLYLEQTANGELVPDYRVIARFPETGAPR